VDYDAPAILRFMIGKALKHCPKRGVDMLIEAPRLAAQSRLVSIGW
jgi:hypothetical protein